MIIGIAALAASYFYLAFYHFDWNLVAIEAQERSNKELLLIELNDQDLIDEELIKDQKKVPLLA